MRIKNASRIWFVFFLCFSVMYLFGCESIARKFTRKSKAQKENTEEVIYQPQEYPAEKFSNEDMYRASYNFWKGWAQELTEELTENANHKRQVYCANEMIKNVEKMQELLKPEARIGLVGCVQKLMPIRDEIVNSRGMLNDYSGMKTRLESIKSKIGKEYAPEKMANFIIQ